MYYISYPSILHASFTVTGKCPNNGNDIECCIGKGCTLTQKAPLISQAGNCFDTKYNSCSGGNFKKGLCPGDNDVLCCIKSGIYSPPLGWISLPLNFFLSTNQPTSPLPEKPTPAPAPAPKPNCPAVRKVSSLVFDDIILSQQATKMPTSFTKSMSTCSTSAPSPASFAASRPSA